MKLYCFICVMAFFYCRLFPAATSTTQTKAEMKQVETVIKQTGTAPGKPATTANAEVSMINIMATSVGW